MRAEQLRKEERKRKNGLHLPLSLSVFYVPSLEFGFLYKTVRSDLKVSGSCSNFRPGRREAFETSAPDREKGARRVNPAKPRERRTGVEIFMAALCGVRMMGRFVSGLLAAQCGKTQRGTDRDLSLSVFHAPAHTLHSL